MSFQKVDIITIQSTHGRKTPGQRPPSDYRLGLRAFLKISSFIPLWFFLHKSSLSGLAVLNAASVVVAALRSNGQYALHLQNHHHHPMYMVCYLFFIDYLLSSPLTIAVTLVSARVPGVPPEQDHYLLLLHNEDPYTSSTLIPCMFILSLFFVSFCNGFLILWLCCAPTTCSLSSLHSYMGVPSQCF